MTFLFYGVSIAGPALDEFTWQIAAYALLSLTVVRMVPVALSLLGARLQTPTVGYLGWFGPRGLACIVFGLLILEEADLVNGELIFLVVTWTVMISVLLHGISAVPLSERYAGWFTSQTEPMEEAMEVEPMPLRARKMDRSTS